jgi:hypothetical protein
MVVKAFIGTAMPRIERKGDVYISIGGNDIFLP